MCVLCVCICMYTMSGISYLGHKKHIHKYAVARVCDYNSTRTTTRASRYHRTTFVRLPIYKNGLIFTILNLLTLSTGPLKSI